MVYLCFTVGTVDSRPEGLTRYGAQVGVMKRENN